MEINKYRLGSKLQYNFPGFEEQYAKSNMLRQRHDTTQDYLEKTGDSLDFDYLDQDDKIVTERVKALDDKISNLSNQLATKGYNAQLANQLVGLRREYQKETGASGILGQAKKNYNSAITGWQQWEKENKDQPQAYKNRAREVFMSKYKGLKDEYGQLRDFTPGDITGYRDISADAIEMLKNAKLSSEDMSKFKNGDITPTVINVNGTPMLKFVERTPGSISSNIAALESGLSQLQSEYLDPTKDRGLSAKIAGYTPEYITNTLSNIKGLMGQQVNQGATWNAGIQQLPKGEKEEKAFSDSFAPSVYSGVVANPDLQKKVTNNFELIGKAMNNGKFDSSNITSETVLGKVLSGLDTTTGKVKEEFGIPVGSILKYTPPLLIANGVNNVYNNWSNKSDKEKTEALWEGYKTKYKNYYDLTRPGAQGITMIDPTTGKPKLYTGDDGFKELSQMGEQLETANKTANYNIAIPQPMQYINSNTREVVEKDKPTTWLDSEGKGYTKGQIQKLIKDSGISDTDFPTLLDENGNLYLELYTDSKLKDVEKFTLNPKALADNVKTQWEYAKAIEDKLTSLALTPEEISKFNTNNLTLQYKDSDDGTRMAEELDIYINPDNPIERKFEIVLTKTDPSGKKVAISRKPADFSEFYAKGLKGIFTGVTNRNKVK